MRLAVRIFVGFERSGRGLPVESDEDPSFARFQDYERSVAVIAASARWGESIWASCGWVEEPVSR